MEKKNVEKLLFPLNLQYFAEDGGSNENGGNEGNGNEDQNSNNNSGGSEKTFTQSQVSDMMAKEKNEGRRAMLKALGFSSEDEAKKAIEAYNAFSKLGKDEKDINKEDVEKANKEKNESISRAEAAEFKLACYESGVNKDYIDDVLTIAKTKITDNKNFDAVLKDMKKDKKYSMFFENSNGKDQGGTGSQPGHSGSNGSNGKEVGSYGKTLAERVKPVQKTQEFKSNYF